MNIYIYIYTCIYTSVSISIFMSLSMTIYIYIYIYIYGRLKNPTISGKLTCRPDQLPCPARSRSRATRVVVLTTRHMSLFLTQEYDLSLVAHISPCRQMPLLAYFRRSGGKRGSRLMQQTIVISYCDILWYTMIYYDILYHTIVWYTIIYYTILNYTVLYYTMLYYNIIAET